MALSTPLTTYPGREISPSFAPDGERVAFAWWNGEGYDIYIKQIGSEQPLRLTNNPADDMQPVWSPDGRAIAFLRSIGEETAAILMIPAIGGAERKIGELRTNSARASLRRLLTWLPGGKDLIISDESQAGMPRALFRVSSITGARRQITYPPPDSIGDEAPDLSPDEHTFIFSREINSLTAELYTTAISADMNPIGVLVQLTHLSRLSTFPIWAANGREILFALEDSMPAVLCECDRSLQTLPGLPLPPESPAAQP